MNQQGWGRRARRGYGIERLLARDPKAPQGAPFGNAASDLRAADHLRVGRDRKLLRASPRATIEAFLDAYGFFALSQLGEVFGEEIDYVRPIFVEWLHQMSLEREIREDETGRFVRVL